MAAQKYSTVDLQTFIRKYWILIIIAIVFILFNKQIITFFKILFTPLVIAKDLIDGAASIISQVSNASIVTTPGEAQLQSISSSQLYSVALKLAVDYCNTHSYNQTSLDRINEINNLQQSDKQMLIGLLQQPKGIDVIAQIVANAVSNYQNLSNVAPVPVIYDALDNIGSGVNTL